MGVASAVWSRHSHDTASSSLVSSSFSLSLFSSSLSFWNSRGDGSSASSVKAFCSSTTKPGNRREIAKITERWLYPLHEQTSHSLHASHFFYTFSASRWDCFLCVPLTACSMICRTAFFRLLALSISCSLLLKSWSGGSLWSPPFSVSSSSSFSFSSVKLSSLTSSSSSCSSSTIGGVTWDGRDRGFESESRVCRRDSSFSFRMAHWWEHRDADSSQSYEPTVQFSENRNDKGFFRLTLTDMESHSSVFSVLFS